MRPNSIVALAVIALVATGCARSAPRPAAMASSDVGIDAMMYGSPDPRQAQRRSYTYSPQQSAAYAAEYEPYTLDSGDRLRIVVFGQDQLSNTYAVDPHGAVAMPLIGTVPARGMTTTQLASAIAARLRQNYLRDPSVAVEVETYRPFFIMGEVTHPGQYPYVAGMSAEAAIAIAGGFSPRAAKTRITVTRRIHGHSMRFRLPLNYPLSPGDIVTVGERWF